MDKTFKLGDEVIAEMDKKGKLNILPFDAENAKLDYPIKCTVSLFKNGELVIDCQASQPNLIKK